MNEDPGDVVETHHGHSLAELDSFNRVRVYTDGQEISIGQDVGIESSVIFNSVTASLTGNVTGNVEGDVEGDLQGNVKNEDGTVILDSGGDDSIAVLTGRVTDIPNHTVPF